MEIDKLKAFSLVAEVGGLNKAAENLSVIPSLVTKQVYALQRELNCDLFFQGKRKFVLTEEGRTFLKSTNKILAELRKAEGLLEANQQSIAGEIVISTTNAMANLYMLDALAGFIKAYPAVRLTVVGSDDETHLVFGKVDVAVRPFMSSHEDFDKKDLWDSQMYLYASEDYIKTHGEPKTKEDLAKHRIISYGHYAAFPYREINWHLSLLPQDFQPFLSINSGAAMLKAVENGLGIAPISQMALHSKVPLVKLLPQYPGPSVKVYFYYPEGMRDSQKINELYEYLRKFFSKK